MAFYAGECQELNSWGWGRGGADKHKRVLVSRVRRDIGRKE